MSLEKICLEDFNILFLIKELGIDEIETIKAFAKHRLLPNKKKYVCCKTEIKMAMYNSTRVATSRNVKWIVIKRFVFLWTHFYMIVNFQFKKIFYLFIAVDVLHFIYDCKGNKY